MLVCNVSLRPPRAAITATIAETAAAADATATGFVVFAALVDDPASVSDIVDAYLGEYMIEAASASDAVSAGSQYITAVDEAVTAVDLQDATTAGAAVARQAMTARAFVNTSAVQREANVNGIMVNI